MVRPVKNLSTRPQRRDMLERTAGSVHPITLRPFSSWATPSASPNIRSMSPIHSDTSNNDFSGMSLRGRLRALLASVTVASNTCIASGVLKESLSAARKAS